MDGNAIYSEEVVWEPRNHTDSEYHYREIMTALKSAASKLPRVGRNWRQLGGHLRGEPSDGGIAVPRDSAGAGSAGEIKDMFLRIRRGDGRAARSNQRRRRDRPGRLDVHWRQRDPGHCPGFERSGRVREHGEVILWAG